MTNIEHYVRCPRPTCEKGHVFETVNGIKKPPPYTCSVCKGVGFVPSTAYRGAVALADAAEEFLRQMDALENPRPAGSWFALRDALAAFRSRGQ